MNFGGNLSLNEVGQTDTFYLAGDYAVEYELNNNNLMVRFYQSTSPSLINGRVRQTGLGLSYKNDFDDFNDTNFRMGGTEISTTSASTMI